MGKISNKNFRVSFVNNFSKKLLKIFRKACRKNRTLASESVTGPTFVAVPSWEGRRRTSFRSPSILFPKLSGEIFRKTALKEPSFSPPSLHHRHAFQQPGESKGRGTCEMGSDAQVISSAPRPQISFPSGPQVFAHVENSASRHISPTAGR